MRRNTKSAIEFGRQVRAIRLEKGLTQRELAEKINAVNTYISIIETGRRVLNLKYVPLWADALGVSKGRLLKIWQECNAYDDSPRRIVNKRWTVIQQDDLRKLIGELSAPDRQRVLGYIDAVLEERKETQQKHSCGT